MSENIQNFPNNFNTTKYFLEKNIDKSLKNYNQLVKQKIKYLFCKNLENEMGYQFIESRLKTNKVIEILYYSISKSNTMLKNMKSELKKAKYYNSKYYNNKYYNRGIVRLENNICLLKKYGSRKIIENKKELEYIKSLGIVKKNLFKG